MRKYYLMNKDKPLIEFIIENAGLGEEVTELKRFSDNLPTGFIDIGTWLENRNYAKHKQHFKKWLASWGIERYEGFVEVTHALGINDCLWVKQTDSPLKWGDVNLYTNEFTDVAQVTAFDTGLYGLQLSSTNIQSPEFTLEGAAPKCWKKEDSGIVLYKSALSGAVNFGLEANCEYISSQIASQIFSNVILYDIVEFKGKLCSKCSLFTDERTGYIPFYKILDANRQYNIADIVKICENMGFGKECKEMFFLDSIIFNQDRHLGNFGFLVDNETFQIKNFAPYFDFNISMLCNALDEDIRSVESFKQYEKEYLLGHKLGGRFSIVGQALLDPALKSLIPKKIDFPVHRLHNLSDERVSRIMDIFEYNMNSILQSKIYQIQLSEKIQGRANVRQEEKWNMT